MMSAQLKRPNLWRVLSDTWRIIRSNSLHFLALSLLFIFPISLLNVINTSTLQPSPLTSHYRRLLSTVASTNNPAPQTPPFQKSKFLFQILYALISLIFNLCSVSSITYSTFNGFHRKPVKLSDSLKSILSSFFPLLATKLAYLLITSAIALAFGFSMGFVFLGLALLGFEIDAASKSFMAVWLVMMVALFAVLVYIGVKWFVTDAIVVVESKYGFAPFKRSSELMKGGGGVGFVMMLLLFIPGMILSGVLFGGRSDGGCSGGVVVRMAIYAVFGTALTLFVLAAKTVFFIYCKAFKGELELKMPSYDKLGEVYAPLPRDVVDEV